MKIEKLILMFVGTGMITALIQAIFRKMLVFNLWGYTTTTLHLSILFLMGVPLMTYGLVKLIDELKDNAKTRTQASATPQSHNCATLNAVA